MAIILYARVSTADQTLEHQRTQGDRKYRGRKPTFTPEEFTAVRDLLGQGQGVGAVAKTSGLQRQTVYRIQNDPDGQAAALAVWYPAATFQSQVGRPTVLHEQ